ncbi:hypothetical protein ABT024_10495 [Streptomyces sp. NPDC002812]|uniref:hypothetical protein n=1 Tax=Streptomyces sp. NPDC002812 TaxID=3154434 RepID=UPI0033265171
MSLEESYDPNGYEDLGSRPLEGGGIVRERLLYRRIDSAWMDEGDGWSAAHAPSDRQMLLDDARTRGMTPHEYVYWIARMPHAELARYKRQAEAGSNMDRFLYNMWVSTRLWVIAQDVE